jgi:flagellar assembly factor FliW
MPPTLTATATAHHDLHPAPDAPPSPDVALDAIHFPEGIPGFEACRRFVLLASDALQPLQRIDAVEGPPASFLCVDPRHIVPGYSCRLSAADERRLEVTPTSRLVWLSLVTVEPGGAITANLRAPVVVNADRMLGRQVMPNDALYPVRHVLVSPE